jgi:glucose-6-phosphate 1-dehydrogenase
MSLDSSRVSIAGQVPPPTTVVVLGVGDVWHRLVAPQAYFYYRTGQFNEKFALVAVDFKPLTEAGFKKGVRNAVEKSSFGLGSEHDWRRFEGRIFYTRGNFWGENTQNRQEDYRKLAQRLREIDSNMETEGNFLVYFGLPYFLYADVTTQLSKVLLLESQRELSVA